MIECIQPRRYTLYKIACTLKKCLSEIDLFFEILMCALQDGIYSVSNYLHKKHTTGNTALAAILFHKSSQYKRMPRNTIQGVLVRQKMPTLLLHYTIIWCCTMYTGTPKLFRISLFTLGPQIIYTWYLQCLCTNYRKGLSMRCTTWVVNLLALELQKLLAG